MFFCLWFFQSLIAIVTNKCDHKYSRIVILINLTQNFKQDKKRMAYFKIIVGLINAFSRVIVFVGYWWAFDSMSDFLGSDDLAFRNNIQSW